MIDDHITRAEFEAYLLGLDLPNGLADAIEDHVGICERCAQLGEEMNAKLNRMVDAEREPGPIIAPRRPTPGKRAAPK